MTDSRGPRWHRIDHRQRFDRAVFFALTTLVRGDRTFATSWNVVSELTRPSTRNLGTAAPTLPAGAPLSARSVGESLKRLEGAGDVVRVHLERRYKTRGPRPKPYPGWRPREISGSR